MRCVLFFQAEDGIRDLVRSRGLGDVYKRQVQRRQELAFGEIAGRAEHDEVEGIDGDDLAGHGPVSYTHLTLPTSDLV